MGVTNKKVAVDIQAAVGYVRIALERDKKSSSVRLFKKQIKELEEKKTSGALNAKDFWSYEKEIRTAEKNRTNTYLREKLVSAAEKYNISIERIINIGGFAFTE